MNADPNAKLRRLRDAMLDCVKHWRPHEGIDGGYWAFYVIHSIESILDAYEPSAPSAAAGVVVPEHVRHWAEVWVTKAEGKPYDGITTNTWQRDEAARFILSLPTAAGASQPEPAAQGDAELQRLLDNARAVCRGAEREQDTYLGMIRLFDLVEALARWAGAK